MFLGRRSTAYRRIFHKRRIAKRKRLFGISWHDADVAGTPIDVCFFCENGRDNVGDYIGRATIDILGPPHRLSFGWELLG
jgi:hypothetical protein